MTDAMTMRRSFLPALMTALSLSAFPAVAHADLPSPWQPQFTASSSGGATEWPGIVANPDGSVTTVYTQLDGSTRYLKARTRSADGVWEADKQIGTESIPGFGPYRIVATGDGSVSVGFVNESYVSKFSTKLPGEDWSEPAPAPQETNEVHSGGNGVATPDGGTLFVTNSLLPSGAYIHVYRRSPGATNLVSEELIDTGINSGMGSNITAAVNANGDAVVAWRQNVGGSDHELYVTSYSSQSDEWTTPESINDEAGNFDNISVALNDDGDAAIAYTPSTMTKVGLHTRTGLAGNWSSVVDCVTSDPNAVLPNLNVDKDGDFVVVWQSFDFNDQTSARTVSRHFEASTQSWDPIASVAAGSGSAGAPNMSASPQHDLGLVGLTGVLVSDPKISYFKWDPQSDAWSAPEQAADPEISFMTGTPRVALDGGGNAAVALNSPADSTDTVGVLLRDGSAPETGTVTVPAGGVAGAPISVSAAPFDLWSSVALTSWDFGDGGAVAGASAAHTYAAAGNYTVTVTVTDAAGNTTDESRVVNISPAPAPPANDDDEDTVVDEIKPPAKPPVITAPIIEARLSGKTVTYNVKLSLKSRQSCSGTVTATFTFGNKRYSSKLKLKKVGSACRATGKTTLKKSPSARTKITVKLSGKQVKTRSLSTKR